MSAEAKIKKVKVTRDNLILTLSDGTIRSASLMLYPSLKAAWFIPRRFTRLIGEGEGVRWPLLDYDLSLEGILHGAPEFIPSRAYAKSQGKAGSRPTGPVAV